MANREADIKRLIELKKLQETQELIERELIQEKMKLELKYKEYMSLTSQELERLPPQSEFVESEISGSDIQGMLEDYKKLYENESCYKVPETKEGKTAFSFPTAEAAAEFMLDQSTKNRVYIAIDPKTNTVMAYSNGDGKLYHADGTEFQNGHMFKQSDVSAESFIMPAKSALNAPR